MCCHWAEEMTKNVPVTVWLDFSEIMGILFNEKPRDLLNEHPVDSTFKI